MVKYWVFLFASVVISSFSQILLKKSASKKHVSVLREYLNPYVIAGYIMLVAATILTVLAFRELAYKNGPIIESLGYVFVMLLSYLFLKEKLTKKKVIGNCLIVLGIVVFYL